MPVLSTADARRQALHFQMVEAIQTWWFLLIFLTGYLLTVVFIGISEVEAENGNPGIITSYSIIAI